MIITKLFKNYHIFNIKKVNNNYICFKEFDMYGNIFYYSIQKNKLNIKKEKDQ